MPDTSLAPLQKRGKHDIQIGQFAAESFADAERRASLGAIIQSHVGDAQIPAVFVRERLPVKAIFRKRRLPPEAKGNRRAFDQPGFGPVKSHRRQNARQMSPLIPALPEVPTAGYR